MKNFLTKKNTLRLSSAYALFFLSLFIVSIVCNSSWCRVHDDDVLGLFFFTLLPLLPIFFLTAITYRMKQDVFDYWMKFAIWATPTLMILTFLIMGGGNNGLGVEGVIGGGFDAMVLMILYGTFIGVSIYCIVSKYRQLKRGK